MLSRKHQGGEKRISAAARFIKTLIPQPLKTLVKKIIASIYSPPEKVRRAFDNLLGEIKIARMARKALKRFEELRGKSDLKIHLGCGNEIKPGWVNIDFTFRGLPDSDILKRRDTFFINYDLRREIPLDEGSCEYVYSSHFLEHLEYREGLRLMRICHKALKPGGRFRLVMPDFKAFCKAYLKGDSEYFDLIDIFKVLPDLEQGTESLIDYINYAAHQSGEHKCLYDEEKLVLLLRKTGFSSVDISSYKEGMDPDNCLRRRYSFYIEAVK